MRRWKTFGGRGYVHGTDCSNSRECIFTSKVIKLYTLTMHSLWYVDNAS